MYKKFFHLTRDPFNLTPDPSCFVPNTRHIEALASLYYGVRRHKGFVVVTGEVGTGKTLLLRLLLEVLGESKDIAYAYVFNSRLTSMEFLQYILADLGVPCSGKNKAEMLFDLAKFVMSRHERKMTTVLVIDEAHHLSPELLEEVRLLSNLETADDKLIQILLVGQPELDDMLDSHNLRQLKQRVAIRTHLTPLSEEETRRYIEQRLVIAGANSNAGTLFTDEAVHTVHRFSHGFPRLINTICESSLVTAYAKHREEITSDIVEDVAREFRLEPSVATEDERAVRA
ncbi:MAG TPA: AAA family ATPase [Terracidiphilus sp.]|nr:AAA family ATPase [Terracidiphilus sp.]